MTRNFTILILSLIFINCSSNNKQDNENSAGVQSNQIISKNEAERLHLLGRKAQFEEKDYAKAIKLYQQAIKADSGYILSYDKIAEIYSYNDQKDSTEYYLKQALNHDPTAWMSRANLGNIYKNQGQYEKALHEFVELGKYYKNDPIAFYEQGDIYFKTNQLDKALDKSLKSLELHQKDELQNSNIDASGDAALLVGLIYYKKNNKIKAKEYMNLALQKNTEVPENFRKELGI